MQAPLFTVPPPPVDGAVDVVGAVAGGAGEALAAASLVLAGVGGVEWGEPDPGPDLGLDEPEPEPDLGLVSPVSASQADPESSVPLGVH